MRHLTAEMVANAINQQESRFDAHDVERRLLRDHAIATAKEIIAQEPSGDPLRYFSAVLSKFIDTAFGPQLRKLPDKVETPNLGGKPSKNQRWEKRGTAVVAPPTTPTVEELIGQLTAQDLEG